MRVKSRGDEKLLFDLEWPNGYGTVLLYSANEAKLRQTAQLAAFDAANCSLHSATSQSCATTQLIIWNAACLGLDSAEV